MTRIGGRVTPSPTDVLSFDEAARELGVTAEEFIAILVETGMLLEHPNGGYIPSPHPDLVERPR
jgi:hypothetical protein